VKELIVEVTCFTSGSLLSLKFRPQMVTGIQHLQTPISSPMAQKCISKGLKTIQLVIKSVCAQNTKEAHARAPVKNDRKAHMHPMRDCGHKKLCIPKNNAFMFLVNLPPTSGSSPKLICTQI
jgi:hypothetical protein